MVAAVVAVAEEGKEADTVMRAPPVGVTVANTTAAPAMAETPPAATIGRAMTPAATAGRAETPHGPEVDGASHLGRRSLR